MFDLLIIGGGVNGCGIARDAAGRGLSVLLVEQGDLAGGTSSASTKLIHGGLRYLEQYEFRLVREALQERARLQRLAPHLITPLRFILPTPPGARPRWMIRIGLWLYDHLATLGGLEASGAVSLDGALGEGLQNRDAGAFAYSDCRVDDSRLVIANALGARELGADIRVGTRFVAAEPAQGGWSARIADLASGAEQTIAARAIVNAAGPWIGPVEGCIAGAAPAPVRLVKGSHIVVPRVYSGDHAYFFQNDDGRIMFAIPYLGRTMIGTTDVPFSGDPGAVAIDGQEIDYLCREASRYFAAPIAPAQVLHAWSGVRSLYDDGASAASELTRDYVLRLERYHGAPLLSVFGGKITTYRRLAEAALDQLGPCLPIAHGAWTDTAPLPGGDLGPDGLAGCTAKLAAAYPFLAPETAARLAAAYGSRAASVLGPAASLGDLGEQFGAGLTQREVDHLVAHEWARTADDILWRRSKLGLDVSPDQHARLAAYLAAKPNS